jgi:hypothetical protein
MGISDFFKKLTKSKDPNSKRSRWDMAEMICGKHIRYVTEKQNDVDVVIGREGGFNIREGDLLVYASSKVVFRAEIDELQIWELLSKDGVVLTGFDKETGRERTVIAYYVYYRK